MTHMRLKDIPTELNIRGIHAKTLVHHENATIKNLILKRDEAIPNHQVPVDVTFFVLEGSGIISIDNVACQVVAHDIVLCQANTVMSVKADNNSILSFLNIKTPGIIVKK